MQKKLILVWVFFFTLNLQKCLPDFFKCILQDFFFKFGCVKTSDFKIYVTYENMFKLQFVYINLI